MSKKSVLGLVFTASLFASDIDLSPNRDSLWQQNYGDRPAHWLTAKDSLARESYLQNYVTPQNRATPVQPRSIAEFEPVEAVVIAFASSFGFQVNLIEELTKTTKVIITSTASNLATAKSQVTNSKAIMDSVTFLTVKGVDTYWTRDYGPWCIAEGDQKISIVDFKYNRPRPNDDSLPVIIAKNAGMASYYMDLQQCGGNYMSNGLGEAVSTDLVTDENSNKSDAQVRSLMKTYLGINNYHITPDPLGDYIKHVDCWGKFLAPDKILIGDVSGAKKQAYDDMAKYFSSKLSPYGTPYKVYRTFTTGEPYTNSTIVNNRVFVPTQGTANDANALAVYKEAMPGYDIVPIRNTGPNPWMSTDALHCRTIGVARRDLLYIAHIPLFDTVSTAQGRIKISCTITPYSKKGINPDSTRLWYRKSKDQPFVSTHFEKNGSNYVAYIPFPQIVTPAERATYYSNIEYYISAKDSAGVKNSFPLMGEKDPVRFVSKDDVVSISANTVAVTTFSCVSNPTGLTISAPQTGTFELFSLNGQRLLSTAISSQGVYSIPHRSISSSMVIYRFTSGGTTISKKLSITK